MAELLWLEPTKEGGLPPTSIFFASGRFVLSSFVLGSFDIDKRIEAYQRIVKVLLVRSQKLSLGDVRVKHSLRSSEILGSVFPPYSYPRPPADLSPATSFPDIIAEQELLHGQLEEQDKLKLIFQAVYGGGHFFSHAQEAQERLEKEWDSVSPEDKAGEKCDTGAGVTGECVTGTGEPFAERISPEGDLYRINLRAAKELGIGLDRLFEVAKRSAERIGKDLDRRKIRLLPQSRSLGIEPDAVPVNPVRHSDSYRVRVRPTYRLIHACEIAGLLE